MFIQCVKGKMLSASSEFLEKFWSIWKKKSFSIAPITPKLNFLAQKMLGNFLGGLWCFLSYRKTFFSYRSEFRQEFTGSIIKKFGLNEMLWRPFFVSLGGVEVLLLNKNFLIHIIWPYLNFSLIEERLQVLWLK